MRPDDYGPHLMNWDDLEVKKCLIWEIEDDFLVNFIK
jgi:hypothetical protein